MIYSPELNTRPEKIIDCPHCGKPWNVSRDSRCLECGSNWKGEVKIPPEERLRIYKAMLSVLLRNNVYTGLCHILTGMGRSGIIQDLPELMKQKPEDKDTLEPWWPWDLAGHARRMEVVERAIEKVEKLV